MKKIFNLFVVFLGAAGLTSCLNEDPFFNPEDVDNVVEFYSAGNVQSPAGAVYPLFINSYDIKPEVEMPITISYSGADVAPEDITVTIKLADASVLTKFNDEQLATFEMLPASNYTLPSTTVTIPKGERRVTYVVKLKTDQFDLTKNYAIPLTISSTSSGIISKNFSTAVFAVGAKNKYDGIYSVEGSMLDRNSAANVGYYPKVIELRTVDANTNAYYDHDFDLAGHIFDTGAGLSYYGSFQAVFNFDNSNESDTKDPIESVINKNGQPAPGATARSGKLEVSTDPTMNVITFGADGKPVSMKVTYTMVQAGTPRVTWTETYTYTGAR